MTVYYDPYFAHCTYKRVSVNASYGQLVTYDELTGLYGAHIIHVVTT